MHASGGTTQGAEVVRAYEWLWVGARVGTGILTTTECGTIYVPVGRSHSSLLRHLS